MGFRDEWGISSVPFNQYTDAAVFKKVDADIKAQQNTNYFCFEPLQFFTVIKAQT